MREVAIVVIMVLVVAAGVWMQFFAPCSWHAGTSVKDLPSRCLEAGR